MQWSDLALRLLLLLAMPFASARAKITLTQARLGNVFFSDETVYIPLTCGGDEVVWVARDFWRNAVKSGSVVPVNGAATIEPKTGKLGYFDLAIEEKINGVTVSTKATSFAVVSRFVSRTSSPFGVMTHFAQFNDPNVMPLIARAAISHIRDEQYWNSIETQPGIFSYPAKFLSYMAAAATNRIKPLTVLNWGNRFYDYNSGEFTFPFSDSGRTGYANYALNVLDRYPGQIEAVEVWNEVNAGTFIKGPATSDKAGYYALALMSLYPAIKAAHPSVKVVAGATVPIAHGFFRSLFQKGAMPYLDAVSIHPYVSANGLSLEVSELRELIKEHNAGREKPIWVTEFSMSTKTPEDQYEQATYTAQMAIQMLSQRVERMYYYLMIDDNKFPYRGLVASATDSRGTYTSRPVYVAYANLIRQLSDARSVGRRSGLSQSTYAFDFQKVDDAVMAIWAVKPVVVRFLAASSLKVINIMGEETLTSPGNSLVTLRVTRDPQYVIGKIDQLVEVDNTLVAESESGYSNTQGANGWHYGYADVPSEKTYKLSNFVPMKWAIFRTDNYRWIGPSTFHFVTESGMHPSKSWAIRRWVSDRSAKVTVSGDIARGSGGDGVDIYIFVDGVEMLRRHILPDEAFHYTLPGVVLTIGSMVDFCVGQGANNSFDTTLFESQIVTE